jgi:hypothetical protein
VSCRSPRWLRQGARPKPGVLTIKAGMWFCFKGIVLATPPSIKDSEGDPRGGAARLHPLERALPHPMRCGWDRPPRGLKRKPESVRKQEGNRNVITLSRFLWLEHWRDRQRCRPQPRSPWEQWILRKRAFWAGACHPRFLVRLLETVKCRNSGPIPQCGIGMTGSGPFSSACQSR